MKLDDWLKRDRSLAERLAVLGGLCDALVDAHKLGEVRGALEPAGVDVGTGGTCQLDLDPPMPGSHYAAPEAARGGPPTAKAEIYSAGLICYEVLAGRPGFEPHTRKPLQELCPDVSRDLTDAVTACLEADPDWRPADLSYLLAVIRGQQNEANKPARRVAAPPRTFLETAPRRKHDDRSPLTRGLPVILVLVVMLATGGAWLWFEVLRPERVPPGRTSPIPRAAPPTTVARAMEASPPMDAQLAPSASPPLASPVAAPSVGVARPSVAPTVQPTSAAVRPRPVVLPSAVQPATAHSPAPLAPNPTPPAVAPLAPNPATRPQDADMALPARANPEPMPQVPIETNPVEAPAASGPASIRAIAPFRLRTGALNVLDVHGSNIRADHRARVALSKKHEPVAGFTPTRYQLRNPALLLVFLQVDANVRPGKYVLSLVGADGDETNAFTIEVTGK